MPSGDRDGFAANVFVNCPFDSEYDSLLKPLLFTIIALGFNPRIASERFDAGEQRISKICGLIGASQFSVHDLSRIKSSREGELYRLNLAFELGIDYGSRSFHEGRLTKKRFLVLEKDRFEYMKAISDLSGMDIEAHGNDPRVLIRKVRNWFYSTAGAQDIAGPTDIWYDYTDFAAHLYAELTATGFSDEDIADLPIPEYLDYVRAWTKDRS